MKRLVKRLSLAAVVAAGIVAVPTAASAQSLAYAGAALDDWQREQAQNRRAEEALTEQRRQFDVQIQLQREQLRLQRQQLLQQAYDSIPPVAPPRYRGPVPFEPLYAPTPQLTTPLLLPTAGTVRCERERGLGGLICTTY